MLSGLDSLLALLVEYRSLTFVWWEPNLTLSSMVRNEYPDVPVQQHAESCLPLLCAWHYRC